MHGLGVCYYRGQGVPQDLVQAYAWMNLAAAEGLARAAEGRAEVAENMTREQIAEGQAMTRELLRKLEAQRGAKK